MNNALERIAAALEAIEMHLRPPSKPSPTETEVVLSQPFPWDDVRVPIRLRTKQNYDDRKRDPLTKMWVVTGNLKPKTFRDWIELGRRDLCRGYVIGIRNIGRISIEAIDPVFDDYGLGELWRKS